MAQRTDPIVLIEDLKPKDTIAGYKAACQEGGLIAWADLLPIDDQPQRGFALECGYNTLTGRDPGPRQIDRGTILVSKVRIRMLEAMRAAGWQEMRSQPGTSSIWQHSSRLPTRGQDQAATNEKTPTCSLSCSLPGIYTCAECGRLMCVSHRYNWKEVNGKNLCVLCGVHLAELARISEHVPFTLEQTPPVPATEQGTQIAPSTKHVPVTPFQSKPDQVLKVNRQSKPYQRTISARLVTGTCQACQQSFAEMRFPGPPPRYCASCAKEVERTQRNARRMRSHYKRKNVVKS